jgi:predicted transcriptional regulator
VPLKKVVIPYYNKPKNIDKTTVKKKGKGRPIKKPNRKKEKRQ